MYLETERLILRKFKEEDFADYCAYNLNDPERDRMMGRMPLDSEEAVRQNFNWLKDREERGYVLVQKASQRVIGNLTVYTRGFPPEMHPSLAGKKGYTLSFGIADSHKRQGLMREAICAVIGRLFAEERIDYVGAGYFDFNTASRELQRKLGFVHLYTEQVDIDGEILTVENNILLKENFR